MKKRWGMFFGVFCLSMIMTTQVFAAELSDETKAQATQEVVTEVKGEMSSFDNLSPGVNSVTVDGVTKKVLADENGVLIQKPAGTWYQYDDGWYGDGWYYYEEDNYLAYSKVLTIGGKGYYFNYDARMCTGSFQVYDATKNEYVWRLADANGVIVTTPGWYYYEENSYNHYWYYIQKDGTLLANGIYTIYGTEYGFTGDGRLAIGGCTYHENDKFVSYLMNENGVVIRTKGWHQIDMGYEDAWYYVQDNGTLLADGVHTVNGKKYYFDWDGQMATGAYSVYDYDLDKEIYRLAKEDGELITTQGWHQIDTGDYKAWYYVQSDGTLLVNEIHTVNGKKYYFSPEGELLIGRISIYDSSIGDWVYRITKPDGELVMSGWYEYIDPDYSFYNGWYYVKDGIILRNGIHTINGKDYYFDYSGKLQIGHVSYNMELYITDENGAIIKTPGWYQVDGLWHYIQSDGNLIFNGIYTIAGKRYAFSYYSMQIGSAYINDPNTGKNFGVLTDENGVILEKEAGWYQRDAKWYYFKEKGIIAANELLTINGNDYYFDFDGEMAVGYVRANGDTRYIANSQGIIAKNGWVQYGPEWYYATNDGSLVLADWVEIGGNSYYMDTAGVMVTGYYWVDNCLYRFADSGACVASLGDFVGWKQVDGIWYYFKEKGVSYDGWVDNTYYIEDSVMCYQTTIYDYENYNVYYLDKNGKKVIGWYHNGYAWYYGKEDGVLAEEEWIKIGNTWYYFDYNRVMVTDLAETFNEETGDYELHRFAKDGAWMGQITGKNTWVQGKFYTSEIDEEQWIYFDKNGNWYQSGEVEISGVKYFFDGETLCTDMVVSTGGKWVYVNKNGIEQKLSAGWHQIRGAWYYVKSNGEFATGLQTINGKQYYFEAEYFYGPEFGPAMIIGYVWVEDLDKCCFFGNDGAMITPATGWYNVGKAWYYFKNGIPAQGFQTINGATYYFENGYMCTGRTYVDSAEDIYVFDTSGKLVKNQWVYVNEEWCYADAKGRALTGEHVIGGKKYIFTQYGVMI